MTKETFKILAIDNNSDNLIFLKTIVNSSFPEAEFISADSGKSGFEMCPTENPDIILLNIIMPDMDGYEVCKKIKSDIRLRHIPVIIVISNNTDKVSRSKALEAGTDAFLLNPVDESELKAHIRAMLKIREFEVMKIADKQHHEDKVPDRTEALENELADRKKNEARLIDSLDKINRNRKVMMNLMEDLKVEISERKMAEEKLIEERNLLRTLIDNIPFPIYILDDQCRKIIANRADVENICLSTEEDVIGKTDLELFAGEIGIRGHANNLSVIQTGKPNIHIEENFIDNNGEQKWLLSSQYPLFDAQSEIKGLVGIGYDITERKKVEAELLKSKEKAEESDRLKTAFLHNISHEIRTPMNAIIGFSSLLTEPDLDAEIQKSYTGIITQSSNQLLAIVNDIIEISNIEAGILQLHSKKTDINVLLKNIYKQYKPKASEINIGLQLETEASDNICIINIDETKFIQVISNLLDNAFKFTAAGQISFGYREQNDYLEFFVRDTGIGIPEVQHERIFERFYQVEDSITKIYEGTGLGLAISKAYVEFLGGRIWLTSQPAEGTTFYFTIPRLTDEKTIVKEGHSGEKANFDNNCIKTILIAEDEENNFRLIKTVLSSINLNILHAKNGKEAVDICESDRKIDLVVMDIKMPVMNGYEATEKIKRSRPEVPVIALTAFALGSDRESAIMAGCDDYISKPYKKDHLISMINKYL